jgi:hypothetical protein
MLAPAPEVVLATSVWGGGSRTVSITWMTLAPALMSGATTVALLPSPVIVRFWSARSTVRLPAVVRAVGKEVPLGSMVELRAPEGMTW